MFFEEKDERALPIKGAKLYAFCRIPEGANGLVIIAHGSGSSRFSPRDQRIAKGLYENGLGVFLMDLLTKEEEAVDNVTRVLRFDIPFLAERLVEITEGLSDKKLKMGFFGASTGAAAALMAAARLGDQITAIVSRGGRADLAGDSLPKVTASTLLIVGGDDHGVIEFNEQALGQMRCEKKIEIVPGATHLFEEEGAMDQVAKLSQNWFLTHLR